MWRRKREKATRPSHAKLDGSIIRACLPFVVAEARMRFAEAELLQPRQLRADIPSTTCKGDDEP